MQKVLTHRITNETLMDYYCRPLESLICQMHDPSPQGFGHSPSDSVTGGLPDSLSHLVENESVK